MTAPPPSPAREPPRSTSHPSQPPPSTTSATQHQPPPQPHHYPLSFTYPPPPPPPPPTTHPSSQPPAIPPQPFVPHLTYMEGQFATQALLVEQQRRIKHLEAELASTQLEVMRLRSQVHHVHLPQPQPPSSSDPTAVSVHSLHHPMIGVPHVPHAIRDSATVPHGATVAAAAHAAAAAAALPRSTPISQQQQTHQTPPPPSRTAPQPHVQQNTSQQQEEPKKASSRYWTPDEHKRFLEGLELFGQKDIKAISRHVGTRSATQVRTHAQKYYLRIERERAKAEAEGKAIQGGIGTPGERRIINGKHSPSAKNSHSSGAGTKSGATAKGGGGKAAGSSPVLGSGGGSGTGRGGSGSSNRGGVKSENEIDDSVGKDKKGDTTKQLSQASHSEKTVNTKRGQTGSNGAAKESEKRSVRTRNAGGEHASDSNAQASLGMNNGSSTTGSLLVSQALGANTISQPLSSVPEMSRSYASDPYAIGQGATALVPPNVAAMQITQAQTRTSEVKLEAPIERDHQSQNNHMDLTPQGSSPQTVKTEQTIKNEQVAQAASAPSNRQENPPINHDAENELSKHSSVKEEHSGAGGKEQELGKRPAVPLSKKSPKKRMKKPSTIAPLPSVSASATVASSAGMTPANLPRPASFSGLNGPGTRSIEQKMYSLGEGGGSMSNLRALLRVPNEDQVAGASGSKPPTLRRNGSSNSVLADLSKNVGVLSRSNSFVSPGGKGVTRSNSILSLLSGIPTALRESPSTERLLGLDSGEDRVMATLKNMDTGGAGPSTSGAGPSTTGPAPLSNMGDRSFSFGQLQPMGLDDLEDPSAVALALPEEQKWGDG